jgi:hypothetical protein
VLSRLCAGRVTRFSSAWRTALLAVADTGGTRRLGARCSCTSRDIDCAWAVWTDGSATKGSPARTAYLNAYEVVSIEEHRYSSSFCSTTATIAQRMERLAERCRHHLAIAACLCRRNCETATILWQDTLPVFSFFGGNAEHLANGDVEFDESASGGTTVAGAVYEVTTGPTAPRRFGNCRSRDNMRTADLGFPACIPEYSGDAARSHAPCSVSNDASQFLAGCQRQPVPHVSLCR